MNILLVNWTWYPSGGDWTYIENVSRLYEQNGHQVIPFSMNDHRNQPSEYSDFFIDTIDYKKLNQKKSLSDGVKVLSKSIYSKEAKKKLNRLLDQVPIGVAHLNLIHHYITPSILAVLKERNIPIVWTLHDYTAICPQSTFVSNDQICEKCLGGRFYNCALNRCKKGSFLASSIASFENYFYKFSDHYAYVDHYICPSVFSYEKYKKHQFFVDKLHHLYHGYALDPAVLDLTESVHTAQAPTSRYIVFVGRLEKIKGVATLLEAMKDHPTIAVKIVGDGAAEQDLKRLKEVHQLTNVEFMGKQNKEEVWKIIQGAEFLVCPSEWYEVLGFTIVEAMLMGKPVIGARIGAIPETVVHQQTGLLFEPGNADDLHEKIDTLFYQQDLILTLGKNAKSHAENLFNPQKHFEGLKKIIPGL